MRIMPEREQQGYPESLVDEVVPSNPHDGFLDRRQELILRTRQMMTMGMSEDLSSAETAPFLENEQIGSIYLHNQAGLNLFNVVKSLDKYLYTQEWQYGGERQEEHQETALNDILNSLSEGHQAGYVEMATSVGKTFLMAKITEACQLSGLRVLILAPTKTIANQIIGEGMNKGLTRFAPNIPKADIEKQFGGSKASRDAGVVVSTYQSLNGVVASGHIGEFNVVLADEAHRALGKITGENIQNFSPNAVKIGFTATSEFGVNKSVSQILPECIHSLDLSEAIKRDLVAPIQCLTFTTGENIRIKDPYRLDFSDREVQQLIHLKSRNQKAIQFAKDFISDGRQGIISCVPGANLAHPKLLATELCEQTIIDKSTGETRNIIAKAIGGTIEETEQILADYADGRIDVITFVNALGEGWDSQVASFLINVCPTTSFVKIKQQIGRVIRKKEDGKTAIVVDFVDQVSGKQQQTALHALGELTISLGMVYGSSSHLAGGESASGYLRHILDSSLYARLEAVDGLLISDLTLMPKTEADRRRSTYYENLLEKEGLAVDSNLMGVPQILLDAMEACRDQYVEDEQRLPTDRELFDYLNNFGYLYRRNPGQEFVRALRAENIEQLGILDDYDIRDDSETNHDPEAQITTMDLKSLADIIRYLLDRREREVVKLRFGLSDQSNVPSTDELMTLEDVGERVNLTKERVRQIEARSLAKLRHGSYGNGTTVRSYFRELDDQELDDFTDMSIMQKQLFKDNLSLDRSMESQKPKSALLTNAELRLLNLAQRVHYRDSLDREVKKSRIGFSEDGLRISQTMTEILPNWEGYSRDLSDIIQTYLSSTNVSSLPTYSKFVRLLANEVESFKDLISLDLDDYPYIRDYDSVNFVKVTKRERLVDYWIPRLLEQIHEQMESNS
jgi:superfamily II DNA or RNA helicase